MSSSSSKTLISTVTRAPYTETAALSNFSSSTSTASTITTSNGLSSSISSLGAATTAPSIPPTFVNIATGTTSSPSSSSSQQSSAAAATQMSTNMTPARVGQLSTGAIVGILLGGVAVVLISMIAILLWRRRTSKRHRVKEIQRVDDQVPQMIEKHESHQLDGRPISYELDGTTASISVELPASPESMR